MYAIMMYAAGVDIVRMIPLNKTSEALAESGFSEKAGPLMELIILRPQDDPGCFLA